MIAYDRSTMPKGKDQYCAYAGRRDGKKFVLTHEEILKKYKDDIRMQERIPDVLSGAMGNQMYVAAFPSKAKMNAFYDDILKCKE